MPSNPPNPVSADTLGVFDHHPDPSTDFCIEVEALEGMAFDVRHRLRSQWPFWGRLSRALRLSKVFGDPVPDDGYTVRAREILRQLSGRVTHG